MAPTSTALTTKVESGTPYQLDPSQTLRAATALLKKIQTDDSARKAGAGKTNLLADNDESDAEDEDATPIWLVLTTKKHVVDQKRLKPGKILLPNPYNSADTPNLRICLITADPQRTYKDLVAHPSFPAALSSKVARVIGITKLKAKYKSYESRRQLFAEYDIFLADDRIITYLPAVLGKVFYAGGSKRPVPVSLQGQREKSQDENGAKRLKLSEGGQKATKAAPKPEHAAKEITRAIGSALVHLAPATTTSVKVAKANQSPEMVAENVEAVVKGMAEKFVTKGWRNIRAVHIKGPETAALPIWLADELWEDEADVLDHAPEPKALTDGKKKQKKEKRKRSALSEGKTEAAEVPTKKRKSLDGAEAELPKKKSKSELAADPEVVAKAARKDALKRQKAEARATPGTASKKAVAA